MAEVQEARPHRHRCADHDLPLRRQCYQYVSFLLSSVYPPTFLSLQPLFFHFSLTYEPRPDYYQTTLYKKLGQTGQNVLLLSGVYGTVGALMNIISINLVDRLGRVKLLFFASAGMCIDLIYSAVMAREFADSDNKVGKGFAILGIYMYTAIYCE